MTAVPLDARATNDAVELTVPAALEFVRMVRLTAAAYADRLGFDIDEIEDIRVAVDELSSVLVESTNDGCTLTIRMASSAGSLHIEGAVPANGAPTLDELTGQILGAVLDSYDVACADGAATFRCRKALPSS